jgi:hypothetical protein
MPSSILNSDDGVISGTSGLKSSGGDDGALAVQSNGTEVAKFKTTELVINDGGANYDFRVEGDTDANLLVVDASTDRVGIGTSSPTVRLNVANTSADCIVHSQALTNGFAAGYRMVANNDAGAAFNFLMSLSGSTEQWYIGGNGNNNTIVFANGSARTERMRIDSSGNLLLGTTSQIIGTHTHSLGVSAPGTNTPISTLVNDTVSRYAIDFHNPNGRVGDIRTLNSGTSYNTSSDYRLKENIAPMTGALAKVAQLKPCTWSWKVDGSDGQGFVAHELQEVIPDCVTGTKDETSVYIDEEGNEQTSPLYQGVDTSFLVATLTAAIQELSAKNDALEARIAALEQA